MKRQVSIRLLAIAVAASGAPLSAHARSYRFKMAGSPDPNNGGLADVNDQGEAVETTFGFVGSQHQYTQYTCHLVSGKTIKTLRFGPAAASISCSGINAAGAVVGGFQPSAASPTTTAFVYRAGTYTLLLPPNAAGGSYADSISNAGLVSGIAIDAAGTPSAFVFDGAAYRTIDTHGLGTVEEATINDSGQLGLTFKPSASNVTTAYLMTGSTLVQMQPPRAYQHVYAGKINNGGQVALCWIGRQGVYHEAGAYDSTTGLYSTVNYPNARDTCALGINNHQTMVGWTTAPDPYHVTGYVASGTLGQRFGHGIPPQ